MCHTYIYFLITTIHLFFSLLLLRFLSTFILPIPFIKSLLFLLSTCLNRFHLFFYIFPLISVTPKLPFINSLPITQSHQTSTLTLLFLHLSFLFPFSSTFGPIHHYWFQAGFTKFHFYL